MRLFAPISRLFVISILAIAFSANAGMSKLEAIGMIESGNNDQARGKLGEVSRYQILPAVWKQYSRSRAYTNPAVSSWVAARFLEDLEEGFQRVTGKRPTDFDRYVMWNAGLSYYKSKRFDPNRVARVIRSRAIRYANLRQGPQLAALHVQWQQWVLWQAQRDFQIQN